MTDGSGTYSGNLIEIAGTQGSRFTDNNRLSDIGVYYFEHDSLCNAGKAFNSVTFCTPDQILSQI